MSDLWIGLAVLAGALFVTAGLLGFGVERGWVDQGEQAPALLATIVFELLFGGAVLLLAWRRGIGLRGIGLVRPRRWGPLAIAWAGAYVVLIGYRAALEVLEDLGVDTEALSEPNAVTLEEDERTFAVIVLLGLAVVVVAPLMEELFFRGLWYRGLRPRVGMVAALFISGALFGLFHLNPGVVIPFTLVGALFAWATEESGSLWAAIGAHAGFNGLSFIATVLGAGATA